MLRSAASLASRTVRVGLPASASLCQSRGYWQYPGSAPPPPPSHMAHMAQMAAYGHGGGVPYIPQWAPAPKPDWHATTILCVRPVTECGVW